MVIELEVEVPGTAEEVFAAVATGRGITSWFVPAEVEEREGGRTVLHFGPGMDETGRVVAWDPPRRFAYQAPVGVGGLTYDWAVEPSEGGRCTVRLRNDGFADDEAELRDAMELGWRLFMHNLLLARTHFPGQRAAAIIVNGRAPGPAIWQINELIQSLSMLPPDPGEGDQVVVAADDAPPLSGHIERIEDATMTILSIEPAPGIVFIAAEGEGDTVATSFYAYYFGDDAQAIAARDEPGWRAWMKRVAPG